MAQVLDGTTEELELAEQVPAIVEQAQAMAVVDLGTEREAGDFLKQIATVKTDLESARKELVKPLNDHVKMINDRFKTRTAPLVEADTTVRSKVLAYRRKQEEIAREAQRKLDEETVRRMEEAEKNPTADEDSVVVEVPIPVVPQPLKPTKSEHSAVTVRKVRKNRVTAFTKLPDAYKLANDKMLAGMAKAGAPAPAGVEFYEEDELAVR